MTKVSTEGVGGGTRGYKSRAVTKNKRKKNKNVKPKLVHLINWIQKLGSEKKTTHSDYRQLFTKQPAKGTN